MGCSLSAKFHKLVDQDKVVDMEFIQLRKAKLPVVWIMRGPGCDYSVQLEHISRTLNYAYVHIGDLLRAEIRGGTPSANTICETMDKGGLVNDQIVFGVMKKSMITDIPWCQGYIVDGFPREIAQAKAFETLFYPCDIIVYLRCSDEEITKLLLARRGGKVEDNEEPIHKRLDSFHTARRAVQKAYTKKCSTVDADVDVQVMYHKCRKIIVNAVIWNK